MDTVRTLGTRVLSGEARMSFGRAVSSGFGNYATFGGRSSRSAYWYWTLFGCLASVATSFLDFVVGSGVTIGLLVLAPLLLPDLAVGVRRLHDVDKSGWNYFWVLLPFIGGLYVLSLMLQAGDWGRNSYGDVPE